VPTFHAKTIPFARFQAGRSKVRDLTSPIRIEKRVGRLHRPVRQSRPCGNRSASAIPTIAFALAVGVHHGGGLKRPSSSRVGIEDCANLIKVLDTMKNMMIQQFQHCGKSQLIEGMNVKRPEIRFVLIRIALRNDHQHRLVPARGFLLASSRHF
jgi:hypothetical protein